MLAWKKVLPNEFGWEVQEWHSFDILKQLKQVNMSNFSMSEKLDDCMKNLRFLEKDLILDVREDRSAFWLSRVAC